ncbi:MAG: hypothetical protein JGK21_08610 [Microcoleus sp. PH2017_22_RUC_O_B]|uniref:hypothetical protein n=1 Tax=unclassified Microcoleus TaxID=2642155 RepID=UPI001D4712EC|nr:MULTISPECIES: hypothetical protein [unclassified Microcoleus]MCC3528261.1 hypothetical protein [Microcoleus sp. PH2017_21_RUC_O_A]MCC3540438.1 hypothetical protein [Microcoleus sp. PH2017_22_RUC_O_B]MCC3583918.1 hypothetical protein [Microcoleus sp. PH2017_30_WIL_O_A]TAH16416.1 MAG: hypothetical protein EAZ10_20705 [Oscillatoriales cyanobacterium]
MAFFYKKLSGVEKTNIASIRLKIPFPEKSKLSYNKEYGLFGLRRRKREEGRRKKEEGKGQKEEGKGQKEKGRRFFPLPLSPSPPLPPLPPLPSPPLPLSLRTRFSGEQFLEKLSVLQNHRQRFITLH